MKIIYLFFALFLCSSFVAPTRVVSGTSTTIVSGDDNYIIVHTGAAATYTLGTVSAGFSCSVVNHGTGDITFSTNITTANDETITVLVYNSTQFTPGMIGNSIRLLYDGSVWRSIK